MSFKSLIIAVATAFSASACSNLGMAPASDSENPDTRDKNVKIQDIIHCEPTPQKPCFGGDFPLKPKN
ncbi:MAG: hypothetical protein AUJ12_03905 [Alphaproteobacteria bacterium CG1_02_46_17]|nr:MAG: hypothetical protein AUJ12_03905 [Alphaproteobacteria bacterium CG1_02_46_17]